MTLRIPVPGALAGLRAWRQGELVCWHALLTICSCLTTRILPTDAERHAARQALRGLLYCLAHYFPPWFRPVLAAAAPHSVSNLDAFFERRDHQPVAAPVAAGLFGRWALPHLLRPHCPGLSEAQWERARAALLDAYTPSRVEKTTWAHPVWAILHMLPYSAPLRDACDAAECLYFRALLVALAELLPCPACRSHKWEYCTEKAVRAVHDGEAPPSFRAYLAVWVWEFHHAVDVRLRGPAAAAAFPLDRALAFWEDQVGGWFEGRPTISQ